RNFAAVVLLIPLDGRKFRSTRLGVDGVDLLFARTIDEQLSVASHSIQRKIGDSERSLTRHGGIERIPTRIEDPPRRFRLLCSHGSDCSMASANDRTHGFRGRVVRL